jgi:hypothetical protein
MICATRSVSRRVIPVLLLLASCGGETPAPAGSAAPSASIRPSAASPAPRPAASTSVAAATAAAPSDEAVKAKLEAALPKLRKIAGDEAVLKAIKAQNAKKVPLDQIKALDEDWKKATGVTAAMKPFLENDAATALKKHAAETPAIAEAFAMDDQGALVATISKTSDYWQGDEAKWTKSFAAGAGGELIDKASFDESSQAYSVQVSIAVMDEGKAVGAITVGLSLDKL